MYRIECDPERNRVLMCFDQDQARESETLAAELQQAVIKARGSAGHFDVLMEFVGQGVWNQDLAEKADRLIAWCLANGMRKSASVTTSSLQKLQIKRVSDGNERLQYFADRSDAELWLSQ